MTKEKVQQGLHTNLTHKLKYLKRRGQVIGEKIKEELTLRPMTLDLFIAAYYPQEKRQEQIERFPQFESLLDFWKVGYEKMSQSQDPAHTEKHVDRLFSYLDFFMERFPRLFENVNLEVLVTSFIYHDLWKSQQASVENRSAFQLLKQDLIEGREASKLFVDLAEKQGFDKTFIQSVSRSIYEHADLKLIKSSKESMILSDLDHLDLWSFDRLKEAVDAVKHNPLLDLNKLRNRISKDVIFFFYRTHRFYSDEVEEVAKMLISKFMSVFNREVEKLRSKNPRTNEPLKE